MTPEDLLRQRLEECRTTVKRLRERNAMFRAVVAAARNTKHDSTCDTSRCLCGVGALHDAVRELDEMRA